MAPGAAARQAPARSTEDTPQHSETYSKGTFEYEYSRNSPKKIEFRISNSNRILSLALTVVQRGERVEFTSSSTVARSLSLLSLVLTTLFLERERESAWCTHCSTARRESRVRGIINCRSLSLYPSMVLTTLLSL